MRNTLRRGMALAVSISLCLSLLPTGVLVAETSDGIVTTISEGITPEVDVTGYEQVNLSWDAVAGATSYNLYRSEGGDFLLLAPQLWISARISVNWTMWQRPAPSCFVCSMQGLLRKEVFLRSMWVEPKICLLV